MPTADRTTIRAAIDEFLSKLITNLAAEPPTGTKPFRRVVIGEAAADEHPRPFLAVRLTRAAPIGAVDDDKLFEVELRLRLVTDVTGGDTHGEMLNKVGAIEDYLDGIRNTGVLDGAEGFDDRAWTFTYPTATSGARLAAAEAAQSCVVKVRRSQNRLPA